MTAPDFTPEQLATLERIEAAPAAPESFIGSDGLTNDQRRALSPRIGNGLDGGMRSPDRVPVVWADCNCEWTTKTCEERHTRSAMVPLGVLEFWADQA